MDTWEALEQWIVGFEVELKQYIQAEKQEFVLTQREAIRNIALNPDFVSYRPLPYGTVSSLMSFGKHG